MALRNIQKGNDNPRLRKTSKPVKEINERIKTLVADMYETLESEEGVGLAAPQVGVLRRVILVDDGEGPFEIINPEISNPRGSSIEKEGCLSLLPQTGYVERPEKLHINGLKLNGEEIDMEAEGMLARVICHEVDHLNGVLFTDKVIPEEELDFKEEEEEAEAASI